MNTVLKTSATLFALGLILSACASKVPEPEYAKPTFDHLFPIPVDAERAQIDYRFEASRKAPFVGHLSPLTFENAIQTWSTQRFRPNGNSTDRLVIVVTESSIQEKDLTLDTGISAVFKKQQAFEYTAVLDVTIQLVSPDDRVKSEANVRTRQTRTAGEEATISDKKVIWSEMIARLVNQMDEELRPKLRQYFSDSMRL
ncbi:MAG: hypothetical protein RIF37_05695 [Rhodospirillaceae bacterium]